MSAEEREEARRPVVYCMVPRALAPKAHEPLRRHFRDDASVEVVVERRADERRAGEDRRDGEPGVRPLERRRIRGVQGRRAGERRAPLVQVEAPPLPRRMRAYSPQLTFVERLEPAGEVVEDRDSARLITRFQAGETEVFSTLYMRYFDRVFGYLRVFLASDHEAEEATQEAFARVFESLPRYERRSKPFRAWLFTVVRNLALDRMRERKRTQVMDPEDVHRQREEEPAPLEPGPNIFDWITDREVYIFIERLPVAQRQALALRFMLDLTSSEIAAILDRTPEDVRILQHRALEFLRARLAAVGRKPRRGDRIRMRVYPKQMRVLRYRRFALH